MGKQKDESGGFTPGSRKNETLLGSVEWLHPGVQTNKTDKTLRQDYLNFGLVLILAIEIQTCLAFCLFIVWFMT